MKLVGTLRNGIPQATVNSWREKRSHASQGETILAELILDEGKNRQIPDARNI